MKKETTQKTVELENDIARMERAHFFFDAGVRTPLVTESLRHRMETCSEEEFNRAWERMKRR